MCGLLLRDINEAHFSLQDPDDVDVLPDHVLSTNLGLDFALPIENTINIVYQSVTRHSMLSSTTESNSVQSPTKTRGRKGVAKRQPQMPKSSKRGREDSNDSSSSKPAKRRVVAKAGIPRPDAFSKSFEDGGVFADGVPEHRHSNRLQDKGRTTYLKNGELIRGG